MSADTETQRLADHLAFLDQMAGERGVVLERNVAMAPLTTLRVGGPADRMTTATTVAELVAALRLARDAAVTGGVLGKGSDIVVSDRGIRGLVIRNRADAIEIQGTIVRTESGAAMAALVKRCTAEGLTGLEFGISIPGTVGGAVWANAGAHGREMQDVVQRVTAWSTQGDKIRELNCGPNAWECSFDYRDSRFKTTGEVVLRAELELAPGKRDVIAAQIVELQAHRRATQPLADQNAGSIFRNPPGDHAGRLIEDAGLKGFRIGSAEVSRLHANFIVVDRGGRASHVRRLGDHVRAAVAEKFDVELQYEIEFVGDWRPGEPWAVLGSELAGE